MNQLSKRIALLAFLPVLVLQMKAQKIQWTSSTESKKWVQEKEGTEKAHLLTLWAYNRTSS